MCGGNTEDTIEGIPVVIAASRRRYVYKACQNIKIFQFIAKYQMLEEHVNLLERDRKDELLNSLNLLFPGGRMADLMWPKLFRKLKSSIAVCKRDGYIQFDHEAEWHWAAETKRWLEPGWMGDLTVASAVEANNDEDEETVAEGISLPEEDYIDDERQCGELEVVLSSIEDAEEQQSEVEVSGSHAHTLDVRSRASLSPPSGHFDHYRQISRDNTSSAVSWLNPEAHAQAGAVRSAASHPGPHGLSLPSVSTLNIPLIGAAAAAVAAAADVADGSRARPAHAVQPSHAPPSAPPSVSTLNMPVRALTDHVAKGRREPQTMQQTSRREPHQQQPHQPRHGESQTPRPNVQEMPPAARQAPSSSSSQPSPLRTQLPRVSKSLPPSSSPPAATPPSSSQPRAMATQASPRQLRFSTPVPRFTPVPGQQQTAPPKTTPVNRRFPNMPPTPDPTPLPDRHRTTAAKSPQNAGSALPPLADDGPGFTTMPNTSSTPKQRDTEELQDECCGQDLSPSVARVQRWQRQQRQQHHPRPDRPDSPGLDPPEIPDRLWPAEPARINSTTTTRDGRRGTSSVGGGLRAGDVLDYFEDAAKRAQAAAERLREVRQGSRRWSREELNSIIEAFSPVSSQDE